MGRLDEKSKVIGRRLDRYARTGETAATDRAKRIARKKAHIEACAPMQRRLNAYHAAWCAAGQPQDFPHMDQWELQS